MRKVLLFIISFCLLFLGNLNVHATSYRFIWDETTTFINVSLGDNINQYTSIPKAYLYIDNKVMEDAEISYLTSGDWLYLLTDVDTSKVGEYKVWYKAFESKYSPGQCEGYKTLVTFNVVDDKEPVILDIPEEITYLVGSDKPIYESLVFANDNSGSYNIFIDESSVLYDVVGTYYVNVRVDDGYNVVKEKILVNVVAPIGPIITFLGENNTIKINVGEQIDLKAYFKAYDNIDGDVLNSISYKKFDSSFEQEFELEVSFFDSNSNKSSMIVNILIVDENEPVINLFSESLILEYNSDYLSEFKNNIKEAYVGNKNIKDEIVIDVTNLKNSVGAYTIIYSYTYKDKTVSKSIGVNVLSSVAPILILENFESESGEKPDYFSHITVVDDSDPFISSKVEIDDSGVNYYVGGRYAVIVSVVNSSGLSKTDTLFVTIINENNSASLIEDNMNYIIGGIGIVFLAVVGIIWYNKKRNNKYKSTV